MKNTDIYIAMNDIDPRLIEKSAPPIGAKKVKRKIYWQRIATIAACFCLVLAISVAWIANITVLGDGSIPIWSANPAQGILQFYGDESSIGSSIGLMPLKTGISVTAELVEMLPDTYTFYDDWEQREYGLLKLRTVKLLKGSEMTEEFYFMVPIGYMTDYTIYDTFVITDMAQCGYEYFVMHNKTTGQAERFDDVLFGYNDNSYHSYVKMGTNFSAYTEKGYFDARLWSSTEYWQKSTSGHTAPNTLYMAEKNAAVPIYTPAAYVHTLQKMEGEAKELLEKYISFENGVYVPSFSNTILASGSTGGVSACAKFASRRYINGFATNETVRIGESTYSTSKAQFTESDLAALPDLAAAISAVAKAFDKGKINPPHIEDYEKCKLDSYGIFAWYAKTENGVVGIIRVNWKYSYMFDDAYYIIEYGEKTCKAIDRDDLLELLGEYEKTYIYTGKYDCEGKDILIYAT